MSNSVQSLLIKLFFIGLAVLVGIELAVRLLGEIFWFQEVGYLATFLKRLQTELGAWGVTFLISVVFSFGNISLASHLQWSNQHIKITKPLSTSLEIRSLLPIVLGFSFLISLMLIYYSELAYSAWHIDYSLPKITPSLPEVFNLRSIPEIIASLSQHFWKIPLVILIVIAILKESIITSKILAISISIIFGIIMAGNWTRILQWFIHNNFGQVDPIFHLDLSFYIFKLPVLKILEFWLWGLFLYNLFAVVLIYLLSNKSISKGQFLGFSRQQLRHLYGLASLTFAMIAVHHFLERYQLLYSPRGVTYGASYTDVKVQLPFELILALIALGISLWLGWKGLTGSGKRNPLAGQFSGRRAKLGRHLTRIPFSPLPFYVYISALFLSVILSFATQLLIVEPNELERETPFIEKNIALTRQGFNLEMIDVNNINPQGSLDLQTLDANKLTIKNIRLWDTRPLLETNRQLQQIRPYYRFPDADIDRYNIKTSPSQSQKQQVIIAARELDYSSVPAEAQTWVNEHLVYTHGYGFTLSPVNLVDEGGLPYYFVKDIGTDEDAGGLRTSNDLIRLSIPIGKPRIYYGEITDTYVMTSTKVPEFDFPSGQDNIYNTYDGTGGINIGSFWKRLLFAFYLRDWQMLFTENFTPDTKLLFRRNFNYRIRTIAPFLQYDKNPYLVVADAGDVNQSESPNYLHWVVDAYTTSSYYPYSDPGENKFNYIRNSVKVVVDAYNGDVQFYVADPQDPIIQSWSKIFPELFKTLDDLPSNLRSHLRYPQDLFSTQSERLLTYHMQDPRVFYNREDQWRIPMEIYGDKTQLVEPYYLIINLPTLTTEEFILVNLYTPSSRNNLIAALFGRSDGEDYGKMLLYVLPKQRLVYGTEQIEARINQDPVISQQISLWNRTGSRAVQGNLLVIPIEQSILYVEPLYLEAETNSLPTLVRVIVVYKNRIIMAESLDKALKALFQPPTTAEPTIIRPLEENLE